MDQPAERLIDHLTRRADILLARREQLRADGPGALQRRVVRALDSIAGNLLSEPLGGYDSEDVSGTQISLASAWISLSALLKTWRSPHVDELIADERVQNPSDGPAILLHVIASNTPLLAWTSVTRALLVESASIVRLPQGAVDVAVWSRCFIDALRIADAGLCDLVELTSWPSADEDVTRSAIALCDGVVVYGSDRTVARVRELAEVRPVLGFGSRFSIGIVCEDADFEAAAEGFALDVAIFNQHGCLSPQIIYVIGDTNRAKLLSERLAARLTDQRHLMSLPDADEIGRIREAHDLARMQPGVRIVKDPQLAWSVISFAAAQTPVMTSVHGLVNVCPVSGVEYIERLLRDAGLDRKLQGIAIASGAESEFTKLVYWARSIGVSYVCEPGCLQQPPFSWREDNEPVLSSFLALR